VPVQRCTLPLPTPLLPLWTVRPVQGLSACTTVHFTFTYTSIHPMGHTALYKASVPVQRCTLTLPIPVLSLRAVRPVQSLCAFTTVHFTFTYCSIPTMGLQPVQSLSACTTVHFTFTYTSNNPMGRTALYRASVPVQRCTLTLPIPLLPLLAVRPVQGLSACTTVHFTFTYTSTPPMGRTACTEPQCLYNGAL